MIERPPDTAVHTGASWQELDKRDDELQRSAAELLQLKLRWAERPFREMGRRDARELAVGLIAAHQGALLLSNTLCRGSSTPLILRIRVETFSKTGLKASITSDTATKRSSHFD
jgi:hypothetical protein